MEKCLRNSLILLGLIVSFSAKTQVGITVGDASLITSGSASGCNSLTNGYFSAGAVWFINEVDISGSWEMTASIRLGTWDGGGDGMAFVLRAPDSPALGDNGDQLGYGSSTSPIQPSVAVLMDTYQNPNHNDPYFDHISLMVNGNLEHANENEIAGPVAFSVDQMNVEDGVYHELYVAYDSNSTTISIHWDGELRLSSTLDLEAILESSIATWGFTASTGAQGNSHYVCDAQWSSNTLLGCTDAAACNYDSSATLDDGSCFITPNELGCDCGSFELDFDIQLAGSDLITSVIEATGYITGISINLNFEDTSLSQAFASEFTLSLEAPDGTCLILGTCYTGDCPVSSWYCHDEGYWPYSWVSASTGNYSAEIEFEEPLFGTGTWTVTFINGWSIAGITSYDGQLVIVGLCSEDWAIAGCTISEACNYNPEANTENGTCIFPPLGAANCETGSAYCNEGQEWHVELQKCICLDNCPADVNKNGAVEVNDLLELISNWGIDCAE